MAVWNKVRSPIKFSFKFVIYLFIIDFDIFDWLPTWLAVGQLAWLAGYFNFAWVAGS